MPLRKRKCHTPSCPNHFKAKDGHRKFCSSCLYQRQHKAQLAKERELWKDPKYRKACADYQRQYRKDHLEAVREYNREWMRRYRAGLETRHIRLARGQAISCRCKNCAYYLLGQHVCPRCGTFNK
jgi:hypothetical protein